MGRLCHIARNIRNGHLIIGHDEVIRHFVDNLIFRVLFTPSKDHIRAFLFHPDISHIININMNSMSLFLRADV